MTIIIAVMNQKGGVGKTTTVTNLYGKLIEQGRTVFLYDIDHNLSLYQWGLRAGVEVAFRPDNEQKAIRSIAELNKNQADFVIIDTAGELSVVQIAAMRHSQLVVIPIRPQFVDYEVTAKLLDLIRLRHRSIDEIWNYPLPLVYMFINQYRAGTSTHNNSSEILRILAGKYISIGEQIGIREVYGAAFELGHSIYNHPRNEQAHIEFNRLVTGIHKTLKRLTK